MVFPHFAASLYKIAGNPCLIFYPFHQVACLLVKEGLGISIEINEQSLFIQQGNGFHAVQQLFYAAGTVDAVDAVNQCPFHVGNSYQRAALGGDEPQPANLVLTEMVVGIIKGERLDAGAAHHHDFVERLMSYAMKLQCRMMADVCRVGKVAANLKLVDRWLSRYGIDHTVEIPAYLHGKALPLPPVQHVRQHLHTLARRCGEFCQGKDAHLI